MPSNSNRPTAKFSLNGKLLEAGSPAVAPTDLALVQGQAVFETLAVYHGRLFALKRHIHRLERGAKAFGIACPSARTIEGEISKVLKANALETTPKVRGRITLTAGTADRRTAGLSSNPALLVEATLPPDYEGTVSAVSVPFARNEHSALTGFKTINYGENAIAQRFAREAAADEAIFPNTAGEICESTWANLFLYHKGKIITPPLSSGCLPGVTREIILELATGLGIPIQQRALPMTELANAEAAALTSTLREIQPIYSIDGRDLPMPDFETWRDLRNAYHQYVSDS